MRAINADSIRAAKDATVTASIGSMGFTLSPGIPAFIGRAADQPSFPRTSSSSRSAYAGAVGGSSCRKYA